MRNHPVVIRVFVGTAVLSTVLAGCEEEPPPPRKSAFVSTETARPSEPPKIETSEAPKLDMSTLAPPEVAQRRPSAAAAAVAVDLVAQARDALTAGDLDRALKLARLATKKAPTRSAAFNTLGRVQLRRGERNDAIASFERAVELNPSSSWAENNLGLALIYSGRYDEAVDALEEATALDRVEPYMWNNLGMAYEHLDRLDEARDAYKQAVAAATDGGPIAEQNLVRLAGVKSIKVAKVSTSGR